MSVSATPSNAVETVRCRVVLVVPCFNEAARFQTDEFLTLLTCRPDLGLVFVNDGSIDDTGSILSGLCARCPDRVDVVELEHNQGKAEAVRRGMLHALARRPVLVGFWDADLAVPLNSLTDFLRVSEARPNVEVLLGSRVRLMGRHIERNALRHYVGRLFATMASLALRLPVYDTQCGAKLFRAGPVVQQVFSVPFSSRWAFDVEVLARYLSTGPARARGDVVQQIYEVSLFEWCDHAGSKVTLFGGLRAVLDLLRIWWRYR